MFAKAESHPKDPKKNEESNIRDSEIWVNLNESGYDNPCIRGNFNSKWAF